VSRRQRPAKPALTREGIIAAAVGVMQAEGLSPVTAAGDWRERLIQVLWSYTRILFDQPGLSTRPC